MFNWIKVEDLMPPDCVTVFVCFLNDNIPYIQTAFYSENHLDWNLKDPHECVVLKTIKNVTHWAPIQNFITQTNVTKRSCHKMNRTIKFRAWDLLNKEMYDAEALNMNSYSLDVFTGKLYFLDKPNFDYENPNSEYELITHDFMIPMQYVGLKDKHGKEIYEKDILDISSRYGLPGEKKFGIVKFVKGSFKIVLFEKRDYKYSPSLVNFGASSKDYIICGNEFETPYLLREWY